MEITGKVGVPKGVPLQGKSRRNAKGRSRDQLECQRLVLANRRHSEIAESGITKGDRVIGRVPEAESWPIAI